MLNAIHLSRVKWIEITRPDNKHCDGLQRTTTTQWADTETQGLLGREERLGTKQRDSAAAGEAVVATFVAPPTPPTSDPLLLLLLLMAPPAGHPPSSPFYLSLPPPSSVTFSGVFLHPVRSHQTLRDGTGRDWTVRYHLLS
ncbi:hypothetical protein VDGL01_05345 [Verticillium dahliae]